MSPARSTMKHNATDETGMSQHYFNCHTSDCDTILYNEGGQKIRYVTKNIWFNILVVDGRWQAIIKHQ